MSLSEAIDSFLLEQQLRNNSPATLEFYRLNLMLFKRATGIEELSELTREALVRWRLGLRGRELSPATLRTKDKAVRVFCNWAHRADLLPTNPYDRLPAVKVPPGTGEFVTFSERDVRAMMAVLDRPGRHHRLRDRAMVSVLLDTGVRAGELVSLTLPHVKWAERAILVRGKTGLRAVPALSCLRPLRRFIERERKSWPGLDAVFISQYGTPLTSNAVTIVVRRLAATAEVTASKTGPHTFRHTFAVEYLRNGGDVFSLARILGHRELETTQRYVHWVMGDVHALHAQNSPGGRWL